MRSTDIQRALTSAIRNQADNGLVEQGLVPANSKRFDAYRELILNNVRTFIDSTYPVTREILGEDKWSQLAKNFLRDYRCKSPLFMDISREFFDFLSQHAFRSETLPVFIPELMEYEWLELDVDVAQFNDANTPEIGQFDPYQGVAALADIRRSRLFNYPVHQVSKDNQLEEPVMTPMIIYRDTDFRVRFIHCNPFTYALYEILSAQHDAVVQGRSDAINADDCIRQVLTSAGVPISDAALEGGLSIIKDWKEQQLIQGCFAI